MSSYFSSPEFLLSAAEALWPGRRAEPRMVEVGGAIFQLLFVDGKVRAGLPFCDFVEPMRSAATPLEHLGYLPMTSVDELSAADWLAAPRPMPWQPAPTIRWATFPSFDAFTATVQAKDSQQFGKSPKRIKKLSKEVGEARFEWQVDNPTLRELCMDWKSGQYRRTGYVDMFAAPSHRALFHGLAERGALVTSVLWAGDRPAAVHMGALHEGRLYYWIPAYDPELQRYSVGTLLTEHMMRASFERGDLEFDFLVGGEAYKFNFATHVRVVGPLGTPPLVQRLWTPIRERLVALARRHEPSYRRLQAWKRAWLQRGTR